MELTKDQEMKRRLLQMAFDSIYVLTEDKNWHDTFGGRNSKDVRLILDAMGNLACIIDEYFPDDHEHFMMDSVDEMEFGSSSEECEEALEKAIRHNMKKIIADADQLLETGDFLD